MVTYLHINKHWQAEVLREGHVASNRILAIIVPGHYFSSSYLGIEYVFTDTSLELTKVTSDSDGCE